MATTTDRRSLLKVLAAGSAAAATCSVPAGAAQKLEAPAEAMGMLYDTTVCIGCKSCVVACREANHLEPDTGAEGLWQKPQDLNGKTKNVIKLYQEGDRVSYMKAQCMHCVDPACAAACMLHAFHKNEVTGVVEWDPFFCVGCRYCQMACPFNVPKFEFDKAIPDIVKCELCRHRIEGAALSEQDGYTRYPKGHGPACCEVCPREAVIYGKRTELLQEAKRRIEAEPGKYFEDRVYGEFDGGGTQVLYLSHVPFEKLGLPTLGNQGVPRTAYSIQEGLYKGFIAPVAAYAVLAGVMLRNRRANQDETPSEAGNQGGHQ